jgi:hypothetical protein
MSLGIEKGGDSLRDKDAQWARNVMRKGARHARNRGKPARHRKAGGLGNWRPALLKPYSI